MVVNIPSFRLHDGQRRILSADKRFVVVSAGRRFGKTMLSIEWLTLEPGGALDGRPVAFFVPKYKYIADVWSDLESTLAPVIQTANKTSMRIELFNGGKIDVWTLEDPDAGRGRKYARIVVDEAAHARNLQQAWERAISPTLTDYKGSAWFISTPNGMNYFYDLYKKQDQDWCSFNMPTSTNPHINAEEICRYRDTLPELVFRQEYLAEFVTFGAGMVSPKMIQYSEPPVKLPVFLGVDLAISTKSTADYTSIVAMSRDHAGNVYILSAERFRAGFNEILMRIEEAAHRYNPVMVVIEQVQYQAAVVQELARRSRIPIRGVRPEKDKITRFGPLLTRYEQGLVFHSHAVPRWFIDEVITFPQGSHDDGVDAAVYAFSVSEPHNHMELRVDIQRDSYAS